MPASVMQRAEAVMLNISADLRTIQSQAYALQDNLAQKTHDGFMSQRWVLLRKPVLEACSIGAYAFVAINPQKLQDALKLTDKKEALDLVSKATTAFTSVAVEPSSVSVQASMQKLQAGQTELTTFHNSLQSMMQTHDAALQRLQNMEGANRQTG